MNGYLQLDMLQLLAVLRMFKCFELVGRMHPFLLDAREADGR